MLKSPVGSLPRTAAALRETWWPPCAAPIGLYGQLSGGNWRNPAQRQTCMTRSTALRPSDLTRLSVKNASSCTSGNRDAGSWPATADRRGASCLRTFPVTVTSTSLKTQVGSASRCCPASSTLVRNGNKQTFSPGSRRYRDKGGLVRSPTPISRLETSSRKASKVGLLRSVPIAAPNLAAWSGSIPENTINKQSPTESAAGFAVKCCKIFHQMALQLTCYLASAQLPRRMQWRS